MQSLRRRQAAAKEAASKAQPSATFGALVGHGRRVVLGFSETGKTRGQTMAKAKLQWSSSYFLPLKYIRACYNVGASSAIFRHTHMWITRVNSQLASQINGGVWFTMLCSCLLGDCLHVSSSFRVFGWSDHNITMRQTGKYWTKL